MKEKISKFIKKIINYLYKIRVLKRPWKENWIDISNYFLNKNDFDLVAKLNVAIALRESLEREKKEIQGNPSFIKVMKAIEKDFYKKYGKNKT